MKFTSIFFRWEKVLCFTSITFLKQKLINVSPWTKYNKGRRCLETFYHIKYVGVIYNICWILGKLWQGTKDKCNMLRCYANDNKQSRMSAVYNVDDL